MDTPASVTGPLSRERQNGHGVAAAARRPKREEAEEGGAHPYRMGRGRPSARGLRDTPGRVVEAYEEFSPVMRAIPSRLSTGHSRMCRATTTRDGARHPPRVPLRASHAADHRGRPCGLSAERAHRRHLQARPRRRSLREAATDPGDDDSADRQRHREVLQPRGVAS